MSRRFDNFAARLEGLAAETVPGDDTPEVPTDPDKPTGEPEPANEPEEDHPMADNETPLEQRDDYKAGVSAGAAAANDRMNAVFASEHFAGREAAAAKFLGRASMSAEDITTVLAEMPAAPAASALTAEQQAAAAEEGGRKEMRDAMGKTETKDLGADQNEDGKTGRAAADATWDKANAAVGRVKKEG